MKNFFIKLSKIIQIIILINFINPVFATIGSTDFETAGGYNVTTTVTGTNTDWIRTTISPYEGIYSIESADGLDDDDTGCFEIINNVTQSSEILSFRYKVSSESGRDFLRFYIDGIEQNEWSGTVAWTEQTYNLAVGNHTFRWCYEKDGSISNGDDKAWIDLIDVSLDLNQITNQVFHFDAFDIDGDGDYTNNPSEGANVTTWVDKYNGYNATQSSTPPTYNSIAIKTHSGVVFNGSQTLDISNQTEINTSTYDEKSFAMILKTGTDITTFQNIYEQGGGTRGYAIQIENGKLYVGAWNRNERQSGDQYKYLSYDINSNTEYRIIMVQDSTDGTLANRTIEVFIDGTSIGTVNNVDVQNAHSGGIQLGNSDGTRKLADKSSIGSGHNFFGNIGEFFSWNHVLTTDEIDGIDKYLYDRWLAQDFPPTLPTPGGVTSGLQLWLKADAGTSTITDGVSLTTWGDQSGNGYDASGGVSPTYINNSTSNLNYNPIVDFNGSDQYLENLSNGAYSQSYFAVVIPDNQVDGTLTGQVPFGFDCNSAVLNTGSCGLPFAGVTLGAFTIAINDEVITHAIGSSTGWRSAQIGTASYQASKPMLINMNENSTGNGTEISEKGIILDNYDANTYQTLSTSDYRIGMSMDGANPFPYDGKIAEIINYNSRIGILDKQKIESYLSLKYGITLKSGTQDYIASDGTTNIWTTSSAGAYIYDIFGIGRDDVSELGQIKSASINDNNVITIEAIGEGSNLNPSFNDIDDFEFFTIANNNGGNTWTETDSPSGYNILTKKWKVQEVGEIGNINLDVDVGNSNFDIPNLNMGTNYYFVYDSDNDNLLSDETPISMTNTTGNIWNILGDINNNMIFTFATQASTNNIPTDINLSNNNINENVSAGTTVGTFSTIDADSLDTHTYGFVSGVGDDDNSRLSITTNSLSINESPDYELKSQYNIRIETDDGNGGTFQKQIIIYINNVGETINSIIDFEDISDELKYTVTSGTWTRTTTNPYEGTYSIESDNGGLPNTQSCFEITNTFNATGTISFYYDISSQSGGDFLRFYIDNIEEQSWSGTVPWTNYSKNDVTIGTHSYKWCYIKNGSINTGSDTAFVDYITFNDSIIDSISPVISSINYASGTLLPGGNHNIIINYSDGESGIDTSSDTISLYKWNGSTWGSDIASSGFDLGAKVITVTNATYPTNNLTFGKYNYNFGISDNNANSTSTGSVFYIDEPELIINTGSLDIGNLQNGVTKFSDLEFNITVRTVGVGFDLILNKTSSLLNGTIEITDWDGVNGVGYDKNPYTSTIQLINTNEIIATQAGSININGEKNIYNYNIKFGANIGEEQTAGDYIGNIKFGLDLDY